MVTEDFTIDQMETDEESSNEEELFCERHGVEEQVYDGESSCPVCMRERAIKARERHRIARDPRLEPY